MDTHLPDNRIVVGVDGSDYSKRALDYAADEAYRAHAVLQIVAVYSVVPTEGLIPNPVILDQAGAEDVVRQAIERQYRRWPEVITKGETILGPQGPSLVDVSKDAELLVVGTRGHGVVTGLLLGSVSEYVLHHAHCTTTVVR
jgi:nucleotide-binding universal stress UspA family protein